jgi:hypothetical protein
MQKQKIRLNGPWSKREFKRAKRINIKDAKKMLKKLQKYKITKCKQFTKFGSMMTIVKKLIVCIKSLPYRYLESSIIMMKPWVNQITQKFRSSLERILISDRSRGTSIDLDLVIQEIQDKKLWIIEMVYCISYNTFKFR